MHEMSHRETMNTAFPEYPIACRTCLVKSLTNRICVSSSPSRCFHELSHGSRINVYSIQYLLLLETRVNTHASHQVKCRTLYLQEKEVFLLYQQMDKKYGWRHKRKRKKQDMTCIKVFAKQEPVIHNTCL